MSKSEVIYINGKFLSQVITGVQRFAYETVLALDKQIDHNAIRLVVPPNATLENYKLRNIEIIRYGANTGVLWEQVDLPKFIKKQNGLLINLCNSAPLSNPGIVCIHDAFIRSIPQVFSKKFILWYRTLFRNYEKNGKSFFTVSHFSKYEIGRYYPEIAKRTKVLRCGWEHMDRLMVDLSVFSKNPKLIPGQYFLTVGSNAINKNIRWIIENARYNPEFVYVIAGGSFRNIKSEDDSVPDNVIMLGYVTDNELKALMKNSKAFIFPSFYEGFGLPPLEALACGASLILSDIPVFHEIYKKSAACLDPWSPKVNIAELYNKSLSLNPEEKESVLEKYKWSYNGSNISQMLNSII